MVGRQGMASADAATRSRVASSGGAARGAALSPDERTALARSAANAAHTPAAVARRLVRMYRGLPDGDARRAEVLDILREGGVR